MSFRREMLPEAVGYFESRGLVLAGRGKWRTTACDAHGGSDSLRINTESGGWCCMACGIHGGDVLAYEMAITGADFIAAAKALGAWVDDGKPGRTKPLPFSKSDAFDTLVHDVNLIAVARLGEAKTSLTSEDREALLQAGARMNFILEMTQCQ